MIYFIGLIHQLNNSQDNKQRAMPHGVSPEQQFNNLVAQATATIPMDLYEKLMKNQPHDVNEVKHLKASVAAHKLQRERYLVREKALKEEVDELKRQLNVLSGDL